MLRLALSLLLLANLIIPSGVTRAAAPADDCVMCGHACCCPEVCAPKLQEIKEKDCDRSPSICKTQPETPPAMVHFDDKWLSRGPLLIARSLNDLKKASRAQLLDGSVDLLTLSPAFEIPTPPPRLSTRRFS